MGNDKGQPVARRVFLTKRCERGYNKLQDSIKKLVAKTIQEIALNPLLGYPLKDQHLKDLYSIHCGDFRIVYKYADNPEEIEIWVIAHRSHVYDELLRYRTTTG